MSKSFTKGKKRLNSLNTSIGISLMKFSSKQSSRHITRPTHIFKEQFQKSPQKYSESLIAYLITMTITDNDALN